MICFGFYEVFLRACLALKEKHKDMFAKHSLNLEAWLIGPEA
jgi:hypothetical protein